MFRFSRGGILLLHDLHVRVEWSTNAHSKNYQAAAAWHKSYSLITALCIHLMVLCLSNGRWFYTIDPFSATDRKRVSVRVPAGAVGEYSSPGSAFCADSYLKKIQCMKKVTLIKNKQNIYKRKDERIFFFFFFLWSQKKNMCGYPNA